MSETTPETIKVTLDYTNYKGERKTYHIIPDKLLFISNKWHPEPQWLLKAWDLNKKDTRFFAMKDIHKWSIFILDQEEKEEEKEEELPEDEMKFEAEVERRKRDEHPIWDKQ